MSVSEVELSFCVVNTEQRELLVRCLDAVASERETQPFRCEVLVLDNASRDGSAGAARHHPTTDAVIVNEERRGKGENDTALLRRATGRYCLDAIARERATVDFETEVLVLDNASQDGSVEVASRHPVVNEVIALPQRQGKAANDSLLLERARGRYCLLLNEDSELRPGAVAALHEAITAHPKAGAAGAMLVRPDGGQQPSAWRFPSPRTALIGALFLHRRLTVQSTGTDTREVDWAQSAALLVDRAAAAEIGWFDPAFFVYSDEVDFCKRLRAAGRKVLYVPAAE